MADVTIDQLTSKASPVDSDQIEIDDGLGGSFKTTKAQLLAVLQAQVDGKAEQSALAAHTGDGTIHFTEASITHNNIGGRSAANAHDIGAITGLSAALDSKADAGDLSSHVGNTSNPHSTTHAILPDAGNNTHAQIDAHVDGSVTEHSDVTSAGSGQIITSAERTKLTGVESGAQNNTNTNAGTGAGLVQAKSGSNTPIKSLIGGTDISLTENADDVTINYTGSGGGGAGTYNETEKDGVSQSVGRAKLDFRDTGDATVTVTDDPANDRTIISIDATAAGGGGGVGKGTPFTLNEIVEVSSEAGDGEIRSTGLKSSEVVKGPQVNNDNHVATWNGVNTNTVQDSGIAISDLALDAELNAHISEAGIHINWSITGVEDINDDRIAQSSVTQHQGAINHDLLLNYDAAEHFTEASITHNNIGGRTSGGAHPISAITNLQSELDGKVAGPANSVNDNIAVFDGISGKLVKDSGTKTTAFASSAQGALADTATQPGDDVSTLVNDAGYSTVAAMNDLSDVTLTAPADKQGLAYNGSQWVNAFPYESGASLPAPAGYPEGFLFLVTS